jgi:hypothetical protein
VEPEGLLPHSQESAGPRLCIVVRNMVIFYGEELSAPCPTPKLKDHPLSAVRDCLFNLFGATLHIRSPFLHPQPEIAPCRGDRDILIMAQFPHAKEFLRKLYKIWARALRKVRQPCPNPNTHTTAITNSDICLVLGPGIFLLIAVVILDTWNEEGGFKAVKPNVMQ